MSQLSHIFVFCLLAVAIQAVSGLTNSPDTIRLTFDGDNSQDNSATVANTTCSISASSTSILSVIANSLLESVGLPTLLSEKNEGTEIVLPSTDASSATASYLQTSESMATMTGTLPTSAGKSEPITSESSKSWSASQFRISLESLLPVSTKSAQKTMNNDYNEPESNIANISVARLSEPAVNITSSMSKPSDSVDQQCNETGTPSIKALNTTPTSNFSGNASILDEEVDDLSSNFLSFEEWVQKKADLQKRHKGQSQGQGFDKSGSSSPASSAAQRDKDVEYSVGEENEIDFDLFKPKESEITKREEKYKNRFNFASLDCAATIVKTNTGAKGSSSILMESKESYLLNQCNFKENFIIIELCEDILIDTVMMGNYEFFSSMFKEVEFYISDRYPVSKSEWKLLGKFQAKNVRDIQPFTIENPLIWARYLKIDIKSHYGNEYYCPVSIVRVYGRTMMEEYKLKESEEKQEYEKILREEAVEVVENGNHVEREPNSNENSDNIDQNTDAKTGQANSDSFDAQVESNIRGQEQILDNGEETQFEKDRSVHANDTGLGVQQCVDHNLPTKFEKFIYQLKKNESCEPIELLESSKAAKKAAIRARELSHNRTAEMARNGTTKILSASLSSSSSLYSKRSDPVTQESIYKNIMNRLSLLESNASLSLLYIEEQSKLLSEAFTKLEKKQSAKFNLLVHAINETFQGQMEDFKNVFQKFKSESKGLINQQENVAQEAYRKIDRNFDRLVSEIQFQKKIVTLLFLIVICLVVYVILTRETFIQGEYLDEVLDEEVLRYRHRQRTDLFLESQSKLDSNNKINKFQNNGSAENVSSAAGNNASDINYDIATSIKEGGHDSPSLTHSPQFTLRRSPSPILGSTNTFATSTGAHRPSYVDSSSPLFKRRIKLKFSNKLGSSSSSTILLDDGYGHRRTPSNGSSIASNASGNAIHSNSQLNIVKPVKSPVEKSNVDSWDNNNRRSFSGLRQEVYNGKYDDNPQINEENKPPPQDPMTSEQSDLDQWVQ